MTCARTLAMSTREIDRLAILGRVAEGRLTQREAARQLGLSLRQVEPLGRALRQHGAAGLVPSGGRYYPGGTCHIAAFRT